MWKKRAAEEERGGIDRDRLNLVDPPRVTRDGKFARVASRASINECS